MAKFIRLIKLPTAIRGLTVPDADGNFNVYINRNLSYEVQKKTYKHETEHIKNNDFFSNEPVSMLESRIKIKE